MIRILIVNDGPETNDGLKSELQKVRGLTVVGHATTGDQAMHLARHADVVLMDATADREGALDVIRSVTTEYEAIKVVVIGGDEQAENVLAYVEAGAAGYIAQDASTEEVVEKVTAAEEDKAIVARPVAAQLMSRLAELSNARSERPWTEDERMRRFDELTPRQWEVLGLVADGMSNQQIADQLHITCGTVKNHVHHILQKLRAGNRHEAAAAYLWKLKHQKREQHSAQRRKG